PGSRFGCRVCSDGHSRCLADADCPAGQTCASDEKAAPAEDGLTRECTEFLLTHPEKFAVSPTSPGGDFITPPVTACFGDVTDATPSSPEQLARRDLFLRAGFIPQSFIVTDMFFATIGLGEVVHRRTHERHGWGNVGVQFAPPMLSAAELAALNA